MAAEAVEPDGADDDDEDDQGLDDEECEAGTEGCLGQRMPIWDVPSARRMNWWDDIDRQTERRMTAAVDWMMGDLDPPPCSTEQEAQDRLARMADLG